MIEQIEKIRIELNSREDNGMKTIKRRFKNEFRQIVKSVGGLLNEYSIKFNTYLGQLVYRKMRRREMQRIPPRDFWSQDAA